MFGDDEFGTLFGITAHYVNSVAFGLVFAAAFDLD